MKRLFGLYAILLSLLFSNSVSARHIDAHFYHDYCGYQSFVFSVDTMKLYDKILLSYGDGSKTDTAHATDSTGFTHSYTYEGIYTIRAILIDSHGVALDTSLYSQIYSPCGSITGNLYVDNNANCSYDSGDDHNYFTCHIEVDSAGHPIDTILAYQSFNYKTHTGGISYSFKMISYTRPLSFSCPSSGVISATSSLGHTVSAGAFGFQCISTASFDAKIDVTSRAGRHRDEVDVTINTTSCTSKSGTLVIEFDSRYNYYSYGSTSGGTVSGHTVRYNFSGLSYGHGKYFTIQAEVPGTWLTVGTPVINRAYILRLPYDVDSTTDSVTHIDTVKASFDPNDKLVSPEGNINPGDKLTYTLMFENTGNSPAQNISILDTLDAYLNPNTIQVLTSSFPANTYIFKNTVPNRTVVKFDFVNINLADSSNHAECRGFITFSINAAASLTRGIGINNRAGIYFDDNEVVMTKTVSNLYPTTNVNNISKDKIIVYPNPVNDELIIKVNASQFSSVTILNSLGQIIQQQKIQPIETHINTTSFIPGMYYIMLKGADGVKVEKIEKQ